MKKTLIKRLTCLLLISVFSFMLTACKTDNDDQVKKQKEKEVRFYENGMIFLASYDRATIEKGKFLDEPVEAVIPYKASLYGKEYFVTSIGARAFENCDFITSIIIPDFITNIDNEAFMGCDSLTIYCQASQKPSGWHDNWNSSGCPVVWGYPNNDVASDGFIYTVIDGVRYKASDGVASVARQAKNVTKAEILPSISYKEQNYLVKSIEASAFFESSLTTVTIPDGIEDIGGSAFSSCVKLESAIIPDSVEFIGDALFDNCHKLKSVKLPRNQLVIGENFFNSCYLLENIEIPASVYMINDYAFFECKSLTSVVLNKRVEVVGKNSFYNCRALTIYCELTEKPSGWHDSWVDLSCPIVWNYPNNEIAHDGYIYVEIDGLKYRIKNGEAGVDCQPESLTEAIIPSSITYKGQSYDVKYLGYSIFGKNVRNVVISEGITMILNNAFSHCASLTSIEIPDSVTFIGDSAFYGCESLTSLYIAKGVTSIGGNAFLGCSSLSSVVISNGVTIVGNSAFRYCYFLTSITFNGTIEEWNAIQKGTLWNQGVRATKVICTDGEVEI